MINIIASVGINIITEDNVIGQGQGDTIIEALTQGLHQANGREPTQDEVNMAITEVTGSMSIIDASTYIGDVINKWEHWAKDICKDGNPAALAAAEDIVGISAIETASEHMADAHSNDNGNFVLYIAHIEYAKAYIHVKLK